MQASISSVNDLGVTLVSARAKVYTSHKHQINIIMVGYGDPIKNEMLIQFFAPKWQHPLNGVVIKHYALLSVDGKDVDFYNHRFSADHHSISGKDGFWQVQIKVNLPGLGSSLAIFDEDISRQVNTNQFLSCYRTGMQYHLFPKKVKRRA